MKTPDDFAKVINDRKADPNWKVKRSKPTVIVITMIFAVFTLMATAYGVLHQVPMAARMLQAGVPILIVVVTIAPTWVSMGLAAVTLFACLKRPRWGRPVSVIFALFFGVSTAYTMTHPDPHPVFQIAEGAEQAGAYAGQAMMAFGLVAYAWSMIMGSKAKAYFAGDKLGK